MTGGSVDGGRLAATGGADGLTTSRTRLRLFIARSTPNSVRAERNVLHLLNELAIAGDDVDLEIVDVFRHAKRAITDGVIVTPTLLCLRGEERMTIVGDLRDATQLRLLIRSGGDEGRAQHNGHAAEPPDSPRV